VSDNIWHPLEPADLKDWVRTPENLASMQAGNELMGKTFTYRLADRGYEVRLNDWCNIFTYTPRPTSDLGRY
jgi:hypothetical protein